MVIDPHKLFGELIALRIISTITLMIIRERFPDERTHEAHSGTMEMALNTVRVYPLPDVSHEDAALVRAAAEVSIMSILTAPVGPASSTGE
jgi:hypothetical protein